MMLFSFYRITIRFKEKIKFSISLSYKYCRKRVTVITRFDPSFFNHVSKKKKY